MIAEKTQTVPDAAGPERLSRTGRKARRSEIVDAGSGALGKRFDAYPWRHSATESSYTNSLANRPCRSTVKTLPATTPSNPRSGVHEAGAAKL